MRMGVAALATALVFGAATADVEAHQAPNSVVRLDFGPRSVRAELLLPASELAYAMPETEELPGTTTTVAASPLDRYLQRHIAAETPGGLPWTISVDGTVERMFEDHAYLDTTLELTPPPGGSARRLVLIDDVITHEVRNHYVMVLARSDYGSGLLGTEPELIGFLQYPAKRLTIERTSTASGGGFRSAFKLGVAHIASGADHLLFLFTLLLPAALVARGGAWTARRTIGSTLMHLVGIASAFTVGHSLTLVGAAVLGWSLPARPVEGLIALSVLVSAVHGWRPVFPGREALVAGGFGLVHGLAFAAALGTHVVDPVERGLAVLGFNLGIESVQIAIVAAAAPLVVLLASGRLADAARRAGSGLAAAVAIAWTIERALDLPDLLTAAIRPLALSAIVAALTVCASIPMGAASHIVRLVRAVVGTRASCATDVREAPRT